MAENRRSPGRDPRQRVVPTRSKQTPRWVWVGLIASPIVLIVLVLTLQAGKNSSDSGAPDPNTEIQRLEGEVGEIRQSTRKLFKLVKAEDPSATAKRKALESRVKFWMSEWDALFEPRRNADGDLPDELQAYQKTRAKVNEIRVDLMKATGF
jgi:HAMP domain-containing protein